MPMSQKPIIKIRLKRLTLEILKAINGLSYHPEKIISTKSSASKT